MAWRYRRSLFQAVPNPMFEAFHFVSKRCLSAPAVRVNEKLNSNENQSDHLGRRKLVLTHQMVHRTLLNSPSDLISLTFFMWCAKQNNYFHDSVAFDHMGRVVLRLMKRFCSVKEVLGGLEGVGCVIKAHVFLLLLRIYWRGGMYEFVFDSYGLMECYGFTPNTFARNVIMDVLFKIGRADFAIKVMKETLVPNFLTFNIALRNLTKLNDLVSIKSTFRFMIKMQYYPNAGVFEMVLKCFCKMDRMAEACQLLGMMITLGISLSVNIWSIMIDGFCRLRKLGFASYLLAKMVEIDCSPTVVTYTTIIKGYIDSHLLSHAFGVLNIMESKGYTPDLVLCNVLISSLSRIGRYDDAFCVFASLIEHKMVPDCYTLSSMFSIIGLSKRFSILPKLVNGLSSGGDLVVCNSLLTCLCKARFHSLAVELYTVMVDGGFTPDKYSFVELLRGLCGSRRIDEAFNVYHGILLSNSCLDAHIHTTIIDGLIKGGKISSAISVFRSKRHSLDVVSYTVAINGLIKGSRLLEACNLYNQMKEGGIAPSAHICNMMLTGFCKERDYERINQMLNEMIDMRAKLSCSSFFRLFNILCRLRDSHFLFGTLTEMRNLGLIPAEVVREVLLSDKAAKAVVDQHHMFLKSYLRRDSHIDSSSSEDLSDVTASFG